MYRNTVQNQPEQHVLSRVVEQRPTQSSNFNSLCCKLNLSCTLCRNFNPLYFNMFLIRLRVTISMLVKLSTYGIYLIILIHVCVCLRVCTCNFSHTYTCIKYIVKHIVHNVFRSIISSSIFQDQLTEVSHINSNVL